MGYSLTAFFYAFIIVYAQEAYYCKSVNKLQGVKLKPELIN